MTRVSRVHQNGTFYVLDQCTARNGFGKRLGGVIGLLRCDLMRMMAKRSERCWGGEQLHVLWKSYLAGPKIN